jgi:hypothetical protein
MSTDATTRLKAAIRRLRPPHFSGRGLPAEPLDLRPSNPFEIAMAARLKALETELDQLRSRINWLLTVIVGAGITNIMVVLLR